MRLGRLQYYLLVIGLAVAVLAVSSAPIRAQEAGEDAQDRGSVC